VALAEVGVLVIVELVDGLVSGVVETVGGVSEDEVAPLRGRAPDVVDPGEEKLVDAMVDVIGKGLTVVGDAVM
jgi:hypothetical protein